MDEPLRVRERWLQSEWVREWVSGWVIEWSMWMNKVNERVSVREQGRVWFVRLFQIQYALETIMFKKRLGLSMPSSVKPYLGVGLSHRFRKEHLFEQIETREEWAMWGWTVVRTKIYLCARVTVWVSLFGNKLSTPSIACSPKGEGCQLQSQKVLPLTYSWPSASNLKGNQGTRPIRWTIKKVLARIAKTTSQHSTGQLSLSQPHLRTWIFDLSFILHRSILWPFSSSGQGVKVDERKMAT